MTQQPRFLLSSNPDNLAAALANKRSVTIEAEYGERVVSGSMATLAHHGPRSGNPCPCLADPFTDQPEVVGLSHLDLDSIGGCAAVLGEKPMPFSFWCLAAFVDTNGAHKLRYAVATNDDLHALNAWLAWNDSHKVFPPRDESVLDVSAQVNDAIVALRLIEEGDAALLMAGQKFKDDEEKLNIESFISISAEGVVLRRSSSFVNHLYATPDGRPGRAVCALNTSFQSCTVSLADPIEGVNCRVIVQTLWGEKAGGHNQIAGSPRENAMTEADLLALYAATCFRLK